MQESDTKFVDEIAHQDLGRPKSREEARSGTDKATASTTYTTRRVTGKRIWGIEEVSAGAAAMILERAILGLLVGWLLNGSCNGTSSHAMLLLIIKLIIIID